MGSRTAEVGQADPACRGPADSFPPCIAGRGNPPGPARGVSCGPRAAASLASSLEVTEHSFPSGTRRAWNLLARLPADRSITARRVVAEMNSGAPPHHDVAVALLGAINLRTTRTTRPVLGQKQQMLLCLLSVSPGRPISSDQLTDALWDGRPPATASAALRVHVARLREALATVAAPTPKLVHASPGYALEILDERIDSVRFGSLLGESAASDLRAKLRQLESALELWRGEPYGGLRGPELLDVEARRLRQLYEAALEDHAEVLLRLGENQLATAELEALIRADPLRERRSMLLMIALYRAGRQAESLEVYENLRRTLSDELGLVPSTELRQAQGAVLNQDDGALQRLVPREPDQISVVSQTARLPWWLESTLTTKMHGRDAVMVRLMDEVSRRDPAATEPGVQVLLLRGEAGVGKTRLLAELASRLANRGLRVLAGWCDPEGVIPFRPLSEALRHLVDESSASLWPSAVSRAADRITRYFEDERHGAGDPETDRLRYFEAAAGLLRLAGEHFPLLLAIDDVQWLDPSSAAMLRYLLRQPMPHRVVVVACYRSDPAEHSRAWSLSLEELTRLSACTTYDVSDLAPEEATRIVSDLLSEQERGTAETLAKRILPVTGGNPLWVREATLALSMAAAAGQPREHVPVPASMLATASHRLNQLSPRTRNLLVAAAILGQRFTLEEVASVGAMTYDEALVALDEAHAAQLVVEVSSHADSFTFRHALLREAILELVPNRRRKWWHLAAGDYYAARSDPKSALLRAFHLLEAVPLCAPDTAAHACFVAAKAALETLAFEEAVRVLEQALSLAQSGTRAGDSIRCDLLVQLGHARSYRGEVEASEQAFMAAADIARSLADPSRLATAALGDDFDTRALTPSDSRIALLLEAVTALGSDDSTLSISVASAYVATTSIARGPAGVRDLAAETIDRARRLGDPAVLSKALLAWLTCTNATATPTRRLDVVTEALQLAEAAGHPSRAARARLARLGCLLRLGRTAEAVEEYQRYRDQAEATRVPRHLWQSEVVAATLYRLSGQFEQAESFAEHALRIGEEFGVAEARMVFGVHTFFLRMHQGRLAELRPIADSYAKSRPDLLSWKLSAALTASAAGDGQAAERTLDEYVERLPDFDPDSEFWAAQLMQGAQLAAELQAEPDVAEQIWRRLLPRRGQFEVFGATTGSLGPVDRALGGLAACRGDHATARAFLFEALEQCRRMNAMPWLVWSGADLVIELTKTGHTSDAGAIIDLVAGTAQRLGMAGQRRRVLEARAAW